ncbi:MAG: OmpA family protein [Gemmatimonadales bacterium]
MTQRALVVALFGLATVVGACGKKAEPIVTPAPVPSSAPSSPTNTATTPRSNADSIARAEAARKEAERAVLVNQIAETIHFEYNEFTIGADDTGRLDRKAAILKANPALRIRVTGHADERGSDEYNLALGMKRSVAAKDYLVRLGIDPSRIEVASLGREVPIDPSANEAAYAKNRRDEFEPIAGAQALVAPR